MKIAAVAALVVFAAIESRAARTLDIYFINVGPPDADATLVVAPTGESMLIDTGYPYHAERVVETVKVAGVKRIDHLLITHYHADHVSGAGKVMAAIPVAHVIDHGPSVETGKSDDWWYRHGFQTFSDHPWVREGAGKSRDQIYEDYVKARGKIPHTTARAGGTLSFGGIGVRVLCAAGKTITKPLEGAGESNPACAQTEKRPEDDGEDEQCIGLLLSFGKFRYVSLGDLAWGRIYAMFCPRNLIGKADVWHVTHHGTLFAKSPDYSEYYWRRSSCLAAEMLGLDPPAAVLSATGKAGVWGTNAALKVIRSLLPSMDLWETQPVLPGTTENKGDPADYNSPEDFIADPANRNEEAQFIKLAASEDGSFTMTNSRSGFTKRYAASDGAKGGAASR